MKRLNVTLLLCGLAISSFAQRELHVSLKGKDSNKGTQAAPLRSITAAAKLAKPGDVVTVHAGVYRELVAPDHGGTSDSKRITFRAAKGERVELKGSEIVKGWKKQNNGLWRLALADSFFKGYNPYKDLVFGDWFFPGSSPVHTGEVYLSGHPLFEVAKAKQPNSWGTEAKGDSTLIWANFGSADPNVQEVEVNVRPACFYPARTGVNYLTIRGFHMSQAATQWAAPTAEQLGLIGTNWSKGWIIEDNIISDSKCTGITLGKDRASGHNVWSADMDKDGAIHYSDMIQRVIAGGWNKDNIGSHLVKNNKVFRCGQAGICGSFGAAYSTIKDNEVYDIYRVRNFGGAEMAGIKIHGAIDAVISGNTVHHAFIGIWLDWMAQGTRVSGNQLYDNDYVDFFPEVNHGPYLVDNNSFGSAFSLRDWSEGGAYLFNTFKGKLSRAPQSRSTPWFQPHGTVYLGTDSIRGGDNRFYGNRFCGGPDGLVRPKMHNWDEDDQISGYGLGIYEERSGTVVAEGNVYEAGARPFKWEKKRGFDAVSSTLLGKTLTSGQAFTGPDGKVIFIERLKP